MFLSPKATVKNHYKTDLMVNCARWFPANNADTGV